MAMPVTHPEHWSLPAIFQPARMAGAVEAFIHEFYSSLDRNPRYAAVIRALSSEQYLHLRQAQTKHLLDLLNPHLDEEEWRQSAQRIGQEHFQNHIPPDWISETYRVYTQHLIAHAETLSISEEERWSICSQFTARLFRDLSMQMAAYAQELQSSHHLQQLPTQLDHLLLTVPSIEELYPRLGDFLLKTVGIDGVWLGSPTEDGAVHCHFVAGSGVAEYLQGDVIYLHDNPKSPLFRSWETGKPEFIDDWTDTKESTLTTFWRERGLRFGWRSSCAIPVTSTGEQRDILILYSKQIKFFAKKELRQLVAHLHAMLGIALERFRFIQSLEQDQQTLLLYKTAMDASANGIVISNSFAEDLTIRYVNPAFERITGYSAEEAVGHNCRFLQGADKNQPQLDVLRESFRKGKACTVEVKNYRKNGTMFWNCLSIAPVRNKEGSTTHFIGIQNDVTKLQTAIAEKAHANALYSALMGTAELVIRAQSERELLDDLCRLLVESALFPHVWVGRPNSAGDVEVISLFSKLESTEYWYQPNVQTDDENRILIVRAWRQSRLVYTNDRLAEPDYPVIQDLFREHGLRATAVVPIYRDGELWSLLTLLSGEINIFNAELLELLERIARLVGHGLDALDLRSMLDNERQHQSWLARHDPLTDILNRRGLMERLEEAISRARRHKRQLAVCVLDLDGFKIINDLHGHPAGDLLLRTIAERLQATLRQTDAVGRMGGDEFVLILEDLDQPEDLPITLSRVQASVETPIQLSNGRTTAVRSSIGVTLFPQDDSSPERLLRHADRALYELKENKEEEPDQRWVVFHAEADEKKFVRQKTILSLFRAGMVRVHYQPVINLQTGKVSGVEALARLVDKNNNLLLPADFLPQLGVSELIALTHQVLAQSIQDLIRAEKAGFSLNVGINFEPSTLADSKAMEDLCLQIESSGLTPHRIVFELLERADTLSLAGSQEALQNLKLRGARIALDDVGSAYSSLLRVKELPIDIIKLDRSFLIGLERQPKELRFIMNMGNLAQSLGLGLVAEGVESADTVDALAALGIRHAQGYFIAQPMGIKELLAWLQQHKPVGWTRPRTLLGAVALQLRYLDATGRMLEQSPSFLQHLVARDPYSLLEAGTGIHGVGPLASQLVEAHRRWHATMTSLASEHSGVVDPQDFQTARAVYEEEMFLAALNTLPSEQ